MDDLAIGSSKETFQRRFFTMAVKGRAQIQSKILASSNLTQKKKKIGLCSCNLSSWFIGLFWGLLCIYHQDSEKTHGISSLYSFVVRSIWVEW